MATTPINRLLSDLAAAEPDRAVITDGRQSLTRSQFEAHAGDLARGYAALGVGLGDWVTILLPNTAEFFIACYACWKLGAIPQPLSWRLPDAERDELIELTDPKLVVGLDEFPGRVTVPQGYVPDPAHDDKAPPQLQISPRWKAIASCGSTRRPHVVVAGSAGEWDMDRRPLRMQHGEIQLVTGPLYHDAHFGPAMFGLFYGHHNIVLPEFDAKAALQAIGEHGVSFMVATPSMLLAMLRLVETGVHNYDLSSLRALWHIGAACPQWLKQAWIDLLGAERIFEFYGVAEAQAATVITGDEWLAHRGSVGRPLFGEIKIVNEQGHDAQANELGDIYMRRGAGIENPHRYIGYEDASVLPDGWQSFGDLGYVDEDGYLYLCDRRTDVIHRGSQRVHPNTVEAVILEHPRVRSCAVVGIPDAALEERIHAVVQVDGSLPENELREFVEQRLQSAAVPDTYGFTADPVRDACDKVRRHALRAQAITAS